MNAHSAKRIEELIKAGAYTETALDWQQQKMAEQARNSLWAYRQFIDPKLVKGWWPKDISDALQTFFWRVKNGERPILILEAPPQHGKSRAVHDAISWFVGHDPHLRVIYASYSDNLGTKANTYLQRVWDDPRHKLTFPRHRIGGDRIVTLVGRPQRNSKFIEFVNHAGSFRNTTVNGQVTGQSLDIGVVDDPIKGRKEANSKHNRDVVWDWLMDDFRTRLSDKGGMIIMATRWHVDDPIGRMVEHFPDAEVLSYSAIAEADSDFRKQGQALFPEFKSLDFLLGQKAGMAASSWESLYQQNPTVKGGDLFPIANIDIVPVLNKQAIKKTVRYWDKAGTQGGGAYTAGVLMHEMQQGSGPLYIIEDVTRGQWSALNRESTILNTAKLDRTAHRRMETWIEQEPGSGGKESAERTIANLRGFNVKAERPVGDKVYRAEPFGAQVQAGNVALLANPKWNKIFLDELEVFPNGPYKDQVDAASAAFSKLAAKQYNYDTSMRWVTNRR